MKIYDHPLKANVTVIEIEKSDENNSFLSGIIDGFEKFGLTYHSSSIGRNEKQVMYLDVREKSVFDDYDNDIECALAIGLAMETEESYPEVIDACISIAESAGKDDLLERLSSKPPEFFDMFKNLKNVA